MTTPNRKSVGDGLLPVINKKSANSFEEAFVVLVEFGEQTFKHYVSQQTPKVQQEIYDVFRLFRLALQEKCANKG